jgi:hydroxypyruvate reductase
LSDNQLIHLRKTAREIFDAALRVVDAREVTARAIEVEGNNITIGETPIANGKPIYAVSIGKAATSMAGTLIEALGDHITQGVITCLEPPGEMLQPNWQVFRGGHPLPNSESLAAAQAAFRLLDRANSEQATVVFLISGGGSAMIEWPVSVDISLADLQESNRQLVSCGATIAEINTVRRAFSAVKGGRLAERAPNARIVTLIISDTNPNDEVNVASGPSLSPLPGLPAPGEIVARYDLESKLPETVLRAVRQSNKRPSTLQANGSHYVLADNRTAIDAACARAKALGFSAVVAGEICEQPIAEGCRQLLERLTSEQAPVCLISGGEFSCPVRGEGRGGRNLETVLRCAMEIDRKQNIVVLSAGTDGIDGNSPAAGAIADETTLSRGRALRLDPESFLASSDSYGFFEQLGDAIVTGPTGTNVRDVRILLS